MKNKPTFERGFFIGRLLIWLGVILGAIYPQTLESYNYATLHYWYGEYHVFSSIGWILVIIGLIIEGILWLHGKE